MKRKDRLEDEWEPMWQVRLKRENKHKLKKMRERKFDFPPELSNHDRHLIRRKARQDARKIMTEATIVF